MQVLERGARRLIDNEPLDPDEVAAFLDGRLEGSELERVQSRLANDSAARQEIIKASRILSTAPQTGRRRSFAIPAVTTLAAAAAIAFVFIQPKEIAVDSTPVASERIGLADAADRIDLAYPADADTVATLRKPFTWHAMPGATYRLVVSDAEGNRILERSTTDTSAAIPSTLDRGALYFWSVDAHASDGSSVTSGVRTFVVGDR